MPEPVYRPVIGAALALFKALDLRIEVVGAAHVPRCGGAVIASNHVWYLDFVFTGLAARHAGKDRLVRFLATELKRRMQVLLDVAQAAYPQAPSGGDDRWWLPAHLGGTAPTPEPAGDLKAADVAERRAKRAARAASR